MPRQLSKRLRRGAPRNRILVTPVTIEALHLKGFRAYLRPQSFDFCRGNTPLSLAVFAPNARGKSSLIDAFEFYFSEHATLERLGIRAAERNAGRAALEHVEAQAKGVSPAVEFSFRQGGDQFGDSRPVTSQGAPRTAAANRVLANCRLPFIIRGYQLRGFVEDETSEQRYEEIVAWFGLQPLLTIQRNLRALRRQVKQEAESTNKRRERLRDLPRLTANAVIAWDEAAVCEWFNKVLAKLDERLRLATLSKHDACYEELVSRKAAEDERLGLTSLKRILAQIEAIYRQPSGDGEEPGGALAAFESAVVAHKIAADREAAERAKASQAVFHDVWAAAKAIFENEDVPLDACPVCDTEIAATPHRSRGAIRLDLDARLGALANYQAAETALSAAAQALAQAYRSLTEALSSLISTLTDTSYAARMAPMTAYQTVLAPWTAGDYAPKAESMTEALNSLHTDIGTEKKRIEEQQSGQTYATALKTADDLIGLKNDVARIDRTTAEIVELNEQLNQQSLAVNKAIVEHTQKLIGKLGNDVNDLYKAIQGGDANAPPIRLELPAEDDINQQRIQLLIDFADNRKGVVPGGYLSDSQIHTLALSLRLAALRLFNTDAPIIILDDVVTSYDADNRKNIAAMLATRFPDHQIIVVTHEERFFALLQDHLPPVSWRFRRIIELRPDFGPAFHDHRTPDDEIRAMLDAGKGAANEIRQAEEEWLLDICRAFRVKVIIRPIDRPYKFERSELAGALAAFLKGAGLAPPPVPGIANPFLASLQKGDVENFGSHFSDNPSETASSGDEKTRWAEFTYFRDLFVCPNCGCNRFVRPEPLDKPVCKKCQTPFSFRAP